MLVNFSNLGGRKMNRKIKLIILIIVMLSIFYGIISHVNDQSINEVSSYLLKQKELINLKEKELKNFIEEDSDFILISEEYGLQHMLAPHVEREEDIAAAMERLECKRKELEDKFIEIEKPNKRVVEI